MSELPEFFLSSHDRLPELATDGNHYQMILSEKQLSSHMNGSDLRSNNNASAILDNLDFTSISSDNMDFLPFFSPFEEKKRGDLNDIFAFAAETQYEMLNSPTPNQNNKTAEEDSRGESDSDAGSASWIETAHTLSHRVTNTSACSTSYCGSSIDSHGSVRSSDDDNDDDTVASLLDINEPSRKRSKIEFNDLAPLTSLCHSTDQSACTSINQLVSDDGDDCYNYCNSDPKNRPFAARWRRTSYKFFTQDEKRLLAREGFVFPECRDLTDLEIDQLHKLRRCIKNKISAQSSRKKKRAFVQQLQEDLVKEETVNIDLHDRVDRLEKLNKTLMERLTELQHQVQTIVSRAGTSSTGTALLLLSVCFSFLITPETFPSVFNGYTDVQHPLNDASAAVTFRSRTLMGVSSSQPTQKDGGEVVLHPLDKTDLRFPPTAWSPVAIRDTETYTNIDMLGESQFSQDLALGKTALSIGQSKDVLPESRDGSNELNAIPPLLLPARCQQSAGCNSSDANQNVMNNSQTKADISDSNTPCFAS